MRATDLIKDSKCPRTRASECSCSKVKTVTEALDTVIAQCELEHSDTVKGTILFIQAPGSPTLIKGTITGLEPGDHGFHIHEFGDITANTEGVASVKKIAERIDLLGDRSIIGRGLVVHADTDDLGLGKDAESKKTGNAGDRLACGVIVLRSDKIAEQAKDWATGERIKVENLSDKLKEFIKK